MHYCEIFLDENYNNNYKLQSLELNILFYSEELN